MADTGYHPRFGDTDVMRVNPAKSVASIVAIIAALLSFYLSSQGREFWALFAAVVAIGAGLLGAARSLSPRVSGGILSIVSIVLGAIAIIVALIALVF